MRAQLDFTQLFVGETDKKAGQKGMTTMFAPLAITSSFVGLVSTAVTSGVSLFSPATTPNTFLEMARGQWQRLNELTGPNSARFSASDIFENTAPLTMPLMQSSLALWVAIGATVAAIAGGLILRGRKPVVSQTPQILIPPENPALPPQIEEEAPPPRDLSLLSDRQSLLSEQTGGHAHIIKRLEDFEQFRDTESELKYVLVQLQDGSYELRVSPAQPSGGKEIAHWRLLLTNERVAGAGYIAYRQESNTIFIDGMSTTYPTLFHGQLSPWPLVQPADRTGLNAVGEILAEKFGTKVQQGMPTP